MTRRENVEVLIYEHKGVTFMVQPIVRQGKKYLACDGIFFDEEPLLNVEGGETEEEAMENARQHAIRRIDERASE